VITFNHIPSGSSCTLQESNAGGATSTEILDSSNAVVSNDATTPYALPGVVTVNTSSLTDDQPQPSYTIRNTFTTVALSVTKIVDSSAVDQDGHRSSATPFTRPGTRLRIRCRMTWPPGLPGR
jgi:large repetitive protein